MQESCKKEWLSAWTDAHRTSGERLEKRRVATVAEMRRRGGRNLGRMDNGTNVKTFKKKKKREPRVV